VTHQTWLGLQGPAGWRAAVKRLACVRARNVFISRAIADAAALRGPVIPNAYDNATFREFPEVMRERDVAFVGRLVSDKGADSLIEAIAILALRELSVRTTIIGNGPEYHSLKARAVALGVEQQVVFSGAMQGTALARELNRHQILAVPSRWNEPFGIVALEGIACGCVVVGTSGGGLPEAIGPCGLTVPNDATSALADALASLIQDPNAIDACRQGASAHLSKFRMETVLNAYEAVIRDMVQSSPAGKIARVLRQIPLL